MMMMMMMLMMMRYLMKKIKKKRLTYLRKVLLNISSASHLSTYYLWYSI